MGNVILHFTDLRIISFWNFSTWFFRKVKFSFDSEFSGMNIFVKEFKPLIDTWVKAKSRKISDEASNCSCIKTFNVSYIKLNLLLKICYFQSKRILIRAKYTPIWNFPSFIYVFGFVLFFFFWDLVGPICLHVGVHFWKCFNIPC